MQLQGRDYFDSPTLSLPVLGPCTIALKIADKWGKLRLQIDERKVSSSFTINHRIWSEHHIRGQWSHDYPAGR